jgi:hypothetical protein
MALGGPLRPLGLRPVVLGSPRGCWNDEPWSNLLSSFPRRRVGSTDDYSRSTGRLPDLQFRSARTQSPFEPPRVQVAIRRRVGSLSVGYRITRAIGVVAARTAARDEDQAHPGPEEPFGNVQREPSDPFRHPPATPHRRGRSHVQGTGKAAAEELEADPGHQEIGAGGQTGEPVEQGNSRPRSAS